MVLITESDENYFDVLCILWVELIENTDKTHGFEEKRINYDFFFLLALKYVVFY